MIDRHELAVAAVNDATRAYYGDRLCALAVFGSVARGTATSDSDIDLFVVVDRLPDGRVARVREFDAVEREVAARMPDAPVLSPVFKTPDELRAGTPLLLDMVEDARVLFDRDNTLGGELARLATRLRELGAQRIWRDGWWYWDLKPDYKPGEVFSL